MGYTRCDQILPGDGMRVWASSLSNIPKVGHLRFEGVAERNCGNCRSGFYYRLRWLMLGIVQKVFSEKASAIARMRQKYIRNASKMRQKCVRMGLVLLGKEERPKCVRNPSKLRQKCAEHLSGRTPFGRYRDAEIGHLPGGFRCEFGGGSRVRKKSVSMRRLKLRESKAKKCVTEATEIIITTSTFIFL